MTATRLSPAAATASATAAATEAICVSEAGDYYRIDPDLDVQAGDRALEIPY